MKELRIKWYSICILYCLERASLGAGNKGGLRYTRGPLRGPLVGERGRPLPRPPPPATRSFATRRDYLHLKPEGLGYWLAPGEMIPMDEYRHFPRQVRLHPGSNIPYDRRIKGTSFEVPELQYTPDFRVPERPPLFYKKFHEKEMKWEHNRYYRFEGYTVKWLRYWFTGNLVDSSMVREFANMQCYCVMVYKRFNPFAMGAVISYRNVLTSAFATEVFLRRYKKKKSLVNLLGIVYRAETHTCDFCVNSSFFAHPARIIFHRKYQRLQFVNRSHPLPTLYDLSLWTLTRRLYLLPGPMTWSTKSTGMPVRTQVCSRYLSYQSGIFSSNIAGDSYPYDGFQSYYVMSTHMVMDGDRVPFPWFRYIVRMKINHLVKPCPKGEWGWFMCIKSSSLVARLGVEPGAPLHLGSEGSSLSITSNVYQGLVGLAAFNMKLRYQRLLMYFTVINTWNNLEWLYDAYKCRTDYEWLDFRYHCTLNSPLGLKKRAMISPWISVDYKDPNPWFWNGWSISGTWKYPLIYY